MLIISFDAVGNTEFEQLTAYPAFRALAEAAAVHRDVSTVFLSNTYPVHTSIATGVMPMQHGLLSNTEAFPARHPAWNSREELIGAETLWQAAAVHGIDTAAVMWPVTAFSETIRYNIPEVLAPPGKSQILTSLAAGSKRLQLKMFLRHRRLLHGIDQPHLDYFATACMTDILREHHPGLALIHLTAYDTLCHRFGRGSSELETAFAALDANLARLLAAAGDERPVIVLSDHSQINVHTVWDPNQLLVSAGLLELSNEAGETGYRPGGRACFMECCGGSAFFHSGTLPEQGIMAVRTAVKQSQGFRRFLTDEEMRVSGRCNTAFGFCARAGFCYDAFGGQVERANHGYPLDMPDYSVFYLVRDRRHPAGVTTGGSLLEIAPLAARLLGFEMGSMRTAHE